MRVFISSTCYDLIDLRADVEQFLKQAGVNPLLSDSATSDFEMVPGKNSIETCLANVRNCDVFIIILSQRYGPSLKSAGYPDVSATHLEYIEAQKANKPIHMYVRDRLEADYGTWKSTAAKDTLRLAWCHEPKDWRIFELLREHRRLAKDRAQSNWLWLFRNSLALKEILAIHFKDAFARAVANRLFEAGRLPFVEVSGNIEGHDPGSVRITLNFTNFGSGPAIKPVFELSPPAQAHNLVSLHEGGLTSLRIGWRRWEKADLELKTSLRYAVVEGHEFVDHGTLLLHLDLEALDQAQVSYSLTRREYLGAAAQLRIS
ncbi:MAG: DUF4062 domain-containing protein [Verrucomicrobiota bacterium]